MDEGQKPTVEIRRRVGSGAYRVYARFTARPLGLWVLGHWWINPWKPPTTQEDE